jgi:NADPH-dependent 2,4-dienoyl-CoA reductase/sulfur reductase-like enzyme
MLRRLEFGGTVTVLSADAAPPVDRPNLSKDYLAGTAPEEWIPLRPPEFFAEQRIDLRLETPAQSIDWKARKVNVAGGGTCGFDALLLATGSDPVRLPIPGADLPHVFTLRTLADSRAIIARCKPGVRVVVVGASFIGLEAAAAMRTRGLEVHVVAPEPRPLERVMGPELGEFVRALHEEHGVKFHLGETLTAIDARGVTLKGGGTLPADVVVTGVGVRPNLDLVKDGPVRVDRGIVVDEFLETSVPGVFAAGDVARYPDPRSGTTVRIEHWVVAQRQGQTAARNILGHRHAFRDVPFFWSQHYDVPLAYVGHAETWDKIDVQGSIAKKDCAVRFSEKGRLRAIVTIGRDEESLRAEAELEGYSLVPTN